ncbi:MAG: class I SAM-dependent methyltransferase [Chthoniobacterales bacterium]|nr:class I SAM-dependent methyltransferase [Chthoniobacterales bacterium]
MSEQTPHIEPTLTPSGSLAPAYFHSLYAKQTDPWEFEKSPYEAAKYKATLAALPHARYDQALELGCSIGVLTCQLARRCDHLLAIDVSEAALAQARTRCADLFQVTFEQRDIAHDFPEGRSFDLLILSEVGYYFALPDLEVLRQRIKEALKPGGQLLLVHFTDVTNYPLTADTVHEYFLEWKESGWRLLHSAREKDYRLDLLEVS